MTHLAYCHKMEEVNLITFEKMDDDTWIENADFWFGLISECRILEQSHIKRDTITDWTITARAPIVIKNSLPISGTMMIWEKSGQGNDRSSAN